MHNFSVVKSWVTKAGLDACILLVNGTHHCGYVAVPEPLKDKNFYDWNDDCIELSVHGGITFQGIAEWSEGRVVVGYDCAHAGDLMLCPPKHKGTPMEALFEPDGESVWRDEAYCTEQCESLAQQLMALVALPNPE